MSRSCDLLYQRVLRPLEIFSVQRQIQVTAQRSLWPRARIEIYQRDALRSLLTYAKAQSPWHAKRLETIDPAKFTMENLRTLPIMTKREAMENWNDIVGYGDADLRLDAVNAFLSSLTVESPRYFLNRLRAHATGGSSGTRGVFVWTPGAFVEFATTFARFQFLHDSSDVLFESGTRTAVLSSDHPIHMSQPLFNIPLRTTDRVVEVPATSDTARFVRELNELRPTHIIGFTTAVHRVAGAARLGQLNFAPNFVTVNSEPLLPKFREAIVQAWPQAKLINMWGSTEAGPHAQSCGHSPYLHINEDAVIIEPVDKSMRPTPPGQLSDCVLITNLLNPVFPVIRYVLDDQIMLAPETTQCPCGSQLRQVKEIGGRMDDAFSYNGIKIYTHDLNTVLYSSPHVHEYQIFQTPKGARVVVSSPLEFPPLAQMQLRSDLELVLRKAGVPDPEITITIGDVTRHPQTGKLRRYVPLPT